jgi:hypothetical protein
MEPEPTNARDSNATRAASWNTRAVVLFVVILTMLTGIGVATWLYRPAPPSGLPSDPAVSEALAILGRSLEVDAGDLRFVSSLGESESSGAPFDTTSPARLTRAAFKIEEARARHRFDPRFDCLLGHVALASYRLDLAERRYRAALSLTPQYGEARLGLGVTLARRAALEGSVGSARAQRLEAIAQFAAVDEKDPFYLPALYDRILVLLEVGRGAMARKLAARYETLEPGSVWTRSLERRLDRGSAS